MDWDANCGAQELLELVGVAGVANRGTARERELIATPYLGGVLILSGSELASSLGLLLQRLLVLSVGISDLDLDVLAAGLDGVIVEVLDD